MKKVPNMMKALLVAVVCMSMMAPVTVSAGEAETVLLDGKVYVPGRYTETLSLTGLAGKTNRIQFELKNGDSSGENMVSTVKITLLDEEGNKKEVIISPDQFNQREFSNALGTLLKEGIGEATEITFSIKVGDTSKHRNKAGKHGKKNDKVARNKKEKDKVSRYKKDRRHKKDRANGRGHKEGSITLYVTEYYETGSTRPSGW